MLKKIHLGFYALLLLMSPLVQAATPDCITGIPIPAAQCNALVALYNATDGANWSNTMNKWDTAGVSLNCSATSGNPGYWHGVTCNSSGVTILNLNSNRLLGQIPSDLKALNTLTELNLSVNYLDGSIPSDLKLLTSLTKLNLSYNWLEGSIPSDLKLLVALTELDLSNNDLDGSIPSLKTAEGTQTLTKLNLSLNELSGSIPSDLGELTALTEINLSTNELTGSIPSLTNLTALVNLNLSLNRLTGSIPSDLGTALTALTSLNLSDNNLTGEIPALLTVATLIDLSKNGLTGKIPSDLETADLNLSDNNLSGPIPDKSSFATASLNLSNNNLTGGIPSNLPSGILNLSDNGLTGTIPTLSGLTALTEINLSQNLLTGPFPANLKLLTALRTLLLNDNGLCGPIHTNLLPAAPAVSPITLLRLDNNHLTATNATLRQWLLEKNPTWEGSQTTCPAGTLQFSSATYSVDEGDTGDNITVNIMVSRVDGNIGEVTVIYLTDDITAIGGDEDYVTAAAKLTWATGNSDDQAIPVTITSDDINEIDETFKLKLLSPTGGASIGSPNETIVTIVNDDGPGKLQFVEEAYEITEGNSGTVTVTAQVERVGGDEGVISVKCISSNGTAASGTDYTAVNNTLNWGSDTAGTQPCEVTITPDTDSENDETFSLNLSGPTGGATIGDPSTTEVTIIDDDPDDTFSFASATATIIEANGSVPLTVNRANGSGTAYVSYNFSNGTAKAGEDYTGTNGVLIFPDNNAQTISVPITNDTNSEENETFTVTLTSPSTGAIIGDPKSMTVTITDDDAHYGKLQFFSPTASVNEGDGTIDITVKRVDGSDGAIRVGYKFFDGTAIKGSDYTGENGLLDWADKDAADKHIIVPITLDSDNSEGNETFTVELKRPSPVPGPSLGDPHIIEVTITDEVPPRGTLQFDPATYSIDENGSGTVELTVTRVGGTYEAASVIYMSEDITTTAGVDYVPAVGVLEWANGESASKTIPVTIKDDTESEDPDETFKVTLSSPSGATLGSSDTAVVTIVDDEEVSGGILQFDSATYSIGEDKGSRTIKVTRISGDDGDVSVDYETSSDNSAEADVDYETTSGTLDWGDGDSDPKSFQVMIIDDSDFEVPDETFIVSLGNVKDAKLGTPNTAVVTIEDDGDGEPSETDCLNVSISQKQCEALVALYKDTDGEKWTNNDGWNETQEPCDWHGVKCDDNEKKVLELDLSDNKLTGAIPKAFFKLKKLTVLDLSSNNLEGTDLAQFKSLKKLKTLLLNDCLLYGDIPEIWRKKLKKLKKLNIKDNCLNTQVSTSLKDWLDVLNPGWNENQTSCFH